MSPSVPDQVRIDRVEFASVRVTDRTEWVFAEFHDSGGATAVTEITCGEQASDAIDFLSRFVAALNGRKIPDESQVEGMLGLTAARIQASRPLAVAVSALRTAVLDIQAQHNDRSIAEVLGGAARESVELYANINRSMGPGQRTPRDFAEAAVRVIGEGFVTIKCAPFDEVTPPATADDMRRLARPGLDRVAAVRAAVGPEVRVLVDCHSRFEAHSAPWVAEELAKSDVGWFEEPLQPTKDAGALSEVASQVSVPVAGGETGYGAALFGDLVAQGAVNVIMPDIKYCGGVAEALAAARAASQAGGRTSLHSPSGPISQLASAHATAAITDALPLEHAVNEAPWRAEVITPPERIEAGRFWLPGGPGLRATLNMELLTRLP